MGDADEMKDELTLPGAPSMPGLHFRYFAGEEDIPAVVEVTLASNSADGETEHTSAEMLRTEYRNRTHIPPQDGILLAFVEDRLVASSSIEYSDTSDGERHYSSLGHVHPEWRRRGIGSAMMAWNEGLLGAIAASQVHAGARKLMTWLQEADEGGRALAERRGYAMVRVGHHMVRPDLSDIDQPALAEGLEVRSIRRDMLPQLWDAMIEAFRDHFGGLDGSPAAFRRWTEDPLMELDLLFVAFDGDEMTAGVQGAIDPEENATQGYLRGWTDPVFTRRPWRRKGLAYALLGMTLQALKDRGMTSAQLGVDSENPYQALSLYERHRYEVVRSAYEWHKTLEP